MLSPADAALARRDPHLPGLATIFDADTFVAAVRRSLPQADLGPASSTYVRYKPGMSCLVAYQLTVAGRSVPIYAKAYRPGSEKLARDRTAAGERGPLGRGRFVLEEQSVAVSVFPNDNRLRALRHVADAEARAGLLRKLMPEQPHLWDGAVCMLHYKPERRYVARVQDAAGTAAVLRTYTKPGYDAALHTAGAFRSGEVLRMARTLGHAQRRRTLALEWLPGCVLGEAMTGPTLEPATLMMVGAALAELHTQEPTELVRRGRAMEADALHAVAVSVGRLHRELADRAQHLANRLIEHLAQEPSPDRPIHGDFHPHQVLLHVDSIGLIDLDEAVRSDPAADLGNFVAHLEREVLRGTLDRGRADKLTAALLEGYATATRRHLPARIELYTAAGLLRLAPHPFRDREPDWPLRIEALLDRAQAILRRVSAPTGGVPTDAAVRSLSATLSADHRTRGQGDATGDPALPFLPQALHPRSAERLFAGRLHRLAGDSGRVHVRAARLTRHKPGRRCMIEYDVEIAHEHAPPEALTLVGKARARQVDSAGYWVVDALWHAGFGADAGDGISVPEPVAVIPAFHMWLQRKVPGVTATQLLTGPDGVSLAGRIAEAAHKLHRTAIQPHRRHTIADELRILRQRLQLVAGLKPMWSERLERLLDACERLGGTIPDGEPRGIHRDFYPDQVLVDGSRLYLLDFDLFCEGNPALDIGNFIGHLTEQSLRMLGDPGALAEREAALEECFLKLSGEADRPAVRAYATLTLARHIQLSTQFLERRAYTERLLELCEQRLGTAATGST